jgi:hypothetical protein
MHIILASGGLDSTLTLFLTKQKQFPMFRALVCDYGQKAFDAERDATYQTMMRVSPSAYSVASPKLVGNGFEEGELSNSIMGGAGRPDENRNAEVRDRNRRIIRALVKMGFIRFQDTVILGLPKDPMIFEDSQLPFYTSLAQELGIYIDSLLWHIGDKAACVEH